MPQLPRLMAEAGYLSLCTGKYWHGNPEVSGFTDSMGETYRHVAFEVLTTEDIPTITDNTDHILNLLAAAQKRVAELETKPRGATPLGCSMTP